MHGFRDEAALYDNTFQPYGQIFVMNADGSGQRMLTDSLREDSMPLVHPCDDALSAGAHASESAGSGCVSPPTPQSAAGFARRRDSAVRWSTCPGGPRAAGPGGNTPLTRRGR